MTGGPWCCGVPMDAKAGYQIGSPDDWACFRCAQCYRQETQWGRLTVIKGVEKFIPSRRKVLTVLMCNVPTGVLCRGVCEDQDIFVHMQYPNTKAAMKTLGEYYHTRGYRVIFNLPKESKS